VAEILNTELVMAASANKKFLLHLKKYMRTKIIPRYLFEGAEKL
jgi:hypothetical protein